MVYIDPYPRPNKAGHAATFSIQLPRVNDERKLLGIPRMAVICNLEPSGFYISDAEVIFHEFGHVLASLLARTRYHHVAGSRCALDFVETPSTLMEYFLWDFDVLKLFAKHRISGQQLPERVFEPMRETHYMFSGLDTQKELVLALLDMDLHGPYPLPASTTTILKNLQRRHSIIFDPSPDSHFQSRFLHLAHYAAGYYSYLYCNVFSANIWHKCFKQDPLNRQMGERYRREILQYGGGRNPHTMLSQMLQGTPDIKYYLRQIEVEK